MRTLISQIDGSLNSGAYYLSLFGALTIPDIAGALSSNDGQASGKKYAAWFEQWVRPRYVENLSASVPEHVRAFLKDNENPLTGEACWHFRCSLLHQGRSQHPQSPYKRIIFFEPHKTSTVVHYCKLNDALCIDLIHFCKEVTAGARQWLDVAEHTATYRKNYQLFAQRHPSGLSPYVVGVPIIA